MAFLDETGLKEVWNKIKDKIYPVGSIYMSVSSTNPANIYGGTWEQIAAGRCLIGAGGGYTAGATGGESTHTLTTAEIPSHSHSFIRFWQNNNTGTYDRIVASFSNYNASMNVAQGGTNWAPVGDIQEAGIEPTGGSGAHNNMQPYLVVYIWKRTA